MYFYWYLRYLCWILWGGVKGSNWAWVKKGLFSCVLFLSSVSNFPREISIEEFGCVLPREPQETAIPTCFIPFSRGDFRIGSSLELHPRSLTARPWEMMVVGRRSFPFGMVYIFRGELLNLQGRLRLKHILILEDVSPAVEHVIADPVEPVINFNHWTCCLAWDFMEVLRVGINMFFICLGWWLCIMTQAHVATGCYAQFCDFGALLRIMTL